MVRSSGFAGALELAEEVAEELELSRELSLGRALALGLADSLGRALVEGSAEEDPDPPAGTRVTHAGSACSASRSNWPFTAA